MIRARKGHQAMICDPINPRDANKCPPGCCTVGDCQKPFYARMMCHAHYERFRTGHESERRISEAITEKFWTETILTHDSDECLPWPFAIGDKGYGVWKDTSANHEVCRRTYGKRPTRKHQSAHSCGNRKCVNRHHLRWATPVENEQDKILHGTHLGVRGENTGASRFSDDEIRRIRATYSGEKFADFAEANGMSKSHTWRIIRWKSRDVYVA